MGGCCRKNFLKDISKEMFGVEKVHKDYIAEKVVVAVEVQDLVIILVGEINVDLIQAINIDIVEQDVKRHFDIS